MSIASTFPDGLRVKQVEGALRIKQKRRILLADQPGAGKTAQALVALEMDGIFTSKTATLILCNVTGCQLTWAGELRTRVESQYDVVVCDLTDTRGRKTMPSMAARDEALAQKMLEAIDLDLPLIVLANYEAVRWRAGQTPKLPTLWDITFDAIVIDEAHLVLPTMEDHPKKLTQFWHGLLQIKTTSDAFRIAMSGTPDRGKLWNRYGHWKFLYPTSYRNFWTWVRQIFVVTQGQWGGAEIGKLRREQEWAAYEAEHMVRRTKAEMLEGLPEKQWAGDGGIDLPMTPLQEDAYIDYERYLEARQMELVADGKDGEAQALRLQFALRSRQMATCTWAFTETVGEDGKVHTTGKPIVAGPESSNKLAWLLDWLGSRGYIAGDGFDPSLGKVVIVSYFTEVLHWLQAELQAANIGSQIIAGDTSANSKIQTEDAFQRGDLRIVLLSGYMGVSINLDAADDMIFVDSVHDPDRMEQAEDRIHRASRNHQVTYWRLASIDTGDMVVLQTIDTRYRQTRAMYEGHRGVAFARRMLGYLPEPEKENA